MRITRSGDLNSLSASVCRVLSVHSRIPSLEILLNVRRVDHLSSRWRYESKSELVTEFNKTISSSVQSLCCGWCDIIRRFPCRDPETLAAFTRIIPWLFHWVAAMGIMGELNRALRGLYDLHNWTVWTYSSLLISPTHTCNKGFWTIR